MMKLTAKISIKDIVIANRNLIQSGEKTTEAILGKKFEAECE